MFNALLEAKQRRRDQLSIVANMLEIARRGSLKTQIMYKANLSFTQLNDYLAFLLDNGLITQSYVDGKEGYIITSKGLGFLRRHHELTSMLDAKTPYGKTHS
ncbi:MAG: winged helix-turn-helix domain-containing protein [Candidatus Bathyarchaeia archaeon]